jgi:hypothetical protein
LEQSGAFSRSRHPTARIPWRLPSVEAVLKAALPFCRQSAGYSKADAGATAGYDRNFID